MLINKISCIYLCMLIFLFASCSNDTLTLRTRDSVIACDSILPDEQFGHVIGNEVHDSLMASGEMQRFYIVVADTAHNYYALQKQMISLQKETKLEIDSFGRSYNAKKNQVTLPADSEDEIYAGEYFPRRHESANLSIEHFDTYTPQTTTGNFALVCGIFGTSREADSLARIVNTLNKNTFVITSVLYIGCMH